MDLLIFITIYILATLALTYLSYKKGISWFLTFIISLIFTPVAGFIRYQSVKPIKVYKEARYKCKRCNYYFTEPSKFCPYCEKEGHHIPLHKVYVDMT
ncbi:MAG: hypothetical protein PWR20_458 [Bacteroidales bacterium]|nr:hypothetical protein [Bacteroidales bacterium]NLH51501.1 hypothetical protein [Bacteroidales bacterium]NPV35115.1 hypothetical protein [Bacteroidales bacterium]